MSAISINNLMIGKGHPPVIIAEMSGNHNQSLDRALEIVDAAAEAGVHGLKIQTYTAETMTLDVDQGDFFIEDQDSLWFGKSLYELYQIAHTPWEWHKPIFDRCKEHGMVAFSTPFDATAVDFLERLQVPCYKIASFEVIDLPLIAKVASTGKPLIFSTGMATLAELDDAVSCARKNGAQEIIMLKCTSTYPADPSDSNITTIPHLRDLFNVEVGLSDHTLGTSASVASIALGASLIEKHFTLSRSEGGVDAAFSLEPMEMKTLVQESLQAWQALGNISYGPTDKEIKSLRFRRSLFVAEDMKAGEVLTTENLRIVRPGTGLPPKYFEIFLGKKVAKAVQKGTPLSWDLVIDE